MTIDLEPPVTEPNALGTPPRAAGFHGVAAAATRPIQAWPMACFVRRHDQGQSSSASPGKPTYRRAPDSKCHNKPRQNLQFTSGDTYVFDEIDVLAAIRS